MDTEAAITTTTASDAVSSVLDAQPSSQSNKRRRLSRKEQKARKKQMHRQQQKQQSVTQRNDEDSNTTSNNNVDHPSESKSSSSDSHNEHQQVIDYKANYVPISRLKSKDSNPNENNKNADEATKSTKTKIKSNKWFPKAITVKHKSSSSSMTTTTTNTSCCCSILLFYQYVSPEWDDRTVQRLTEYLITIGEHRPIGGRIRIAPEGLNCTLSSIDDPSTNISAAATLRHFAYDLQAFDPIAFADTDFKYTDQLRSDRHFKQLVILPVREIVYYGLREADAPIAKTGNHVPPQQFHEMLQANDGIPTVVIDVRNHYEAQLGRFDGQQQQHDKEQQPKEVETKSASTTPAQYLDPKMRKSTDWKTYLQDPNTQQTIAGKRVLLYCTGGIRCERASAYLNSIAENILPQPPQQVYQLQGGIEKYLQAFPNGGFWRGKNFVFDKREAVGAGDRNGDGGVVSHSTSTNTNNTASTSKSNKTETVEGCTCVVCHKPWDRYIGKRKCNFCGVPVLVCDTCLTHHHTSNNKHDKKNHTKQSSPPALRCPLCVEQNVTVPVHEVEYTDNGIRSKPKSTIAVTTTNATHPQGETTTSEKKVAPSVLKWGGGHAALKKLRRKFHGKPCKFGAQCSRPDCIFSHPRDPTKSIDKKQL